MTTQTIFWIILAAVLALGISLFQYYFIEKKRTKHWRWFSFLRFISLFALFLLLINPTFIQQRFYTEKPVLVLATDNSRSIAHFDAGKPVKDFLKTLQTDPELNNRFDIHTYAFGENLHQSDSLGFSESQTKIGAVFRGLKPVYKEKTAPVVLITDGNQTYGENYVYAARQLNHPIYPVVVGDTTQYIDLQIGQLNVNKYVFLNNKFSLEAFVNYNGTKPVTSDFLIKRGEQVVFRERLQFSEEDVSQTIQASITAEDVGVKTYTAVIEPISEEKNISNNRKKFGIEVIDQKTNVLIVAGILHPDVGALKKIIESNQQRSATIKKAGGVVDLDEYQLVILYQPNADFQWVYDQIAKRELNTFTITGTATDYAFLNSAQANFDRQISRQTEEYFPVFNENYLVFQMQDIGFADFPPLKDKFGKINFHTVFQPLLWQSIQGYETETPLLASMETENAQKHAYLFGEGLWKWRAKSYRDHRGFMEFDEFMGKLVRYLASGKKRDRLELDFESFYTRGESVVMEARYFDKNFVFDPRATLQITLKKQNTQQLAQRPFLLKNNRFEVNLSDLEPGNYEFTVRVNNQNLSESGQFTLIDFDVEKQFVNANVDGLRKISDQAGKLYFLGQPEKLIRDLLQEERFQPIQKSRESRKPLIDWYYLLAIIILALTVEWFMRKYRGLT